MSKPKQLTPKEKLTRLQKAHDQLRRLEREISKMLGDLEGPYTDAISEMESVAMRATAESIGIEYEALEWMVWENDWGRHKSKCWDSKDRGMVIDSIEAFLKFEGRG